jgi:hypothetical protein
MKINLALYCLVFLGFLVSCNNEPREIRKNTVDKKSEDMININKYLVGKDADIINGFIRRHNWDMNITQTGLRYMIYEKGNGEKVQTGNKVSLKYVLSLMDGTECYNSKKDGLKSFIVGKGEVETGLEEGMLLLHKGDKARFIMMPHLAYGLIGDGNKVPARSIILYDIELIQISK